MRKSLSVRLFFGLLAVPVALVCALPAQGWGVVGHRYANGLAIDCLPAELRPLYEKNRVWIVQHSSDPDQWRNKNRAEAPHHFIDLDQFGVDAVATYPQDYWMACGLFGKAETDKAGVVPWRIGQYYMKLVRAFKQKDARAVVEISTFLGHYVADIHVPFHACANYDGQLTGQKGIHARFESVMVERQIKAEDLKKSDAEKIAEPVVSAFAWARTSYKLHLDVLVADKDAQALDPQYGDAYYKTLGEKTRALAVRRLEESGRSLASLWYSAWLAAGKPNLAEPADVHAGEPLDKPTADPDLPANTGGNAPPANGKEAQ